MTAPVYLRQTTHKSRHFLQRVEFALNIALNEFYCSVDNNVQIGRDLSLRKNDRISGVVDLLEIIENETPLVVRKNIPKENSLLQHGEVGHVLILLTYGLVRNSLHIAYLR